MTNELHRRQQVVATDDVTHLVRDDRFDMRVAQGGSETLRPYQQRASGCRSHQAREADVTSRSLSGMHDALRAFDAPERVVHDAGGERAGSAGIGRADAAIATPNCARTASAPRQPHGDEEHDGGGQTSRGTPTSETRAVASVSARPAKGGDCGSGTRFAAAASAASGTRNFIAAANQIQYRTDALLSAEHQGQQCRRPRRRWSTARCG